MNYTIDGIKHRKTAVVNAPNYNRYYYELLQLFVGYERYLLDLCKGLDTEYICYMLKLIKRMIIDNNLFENIDYDILIDHYAAVRFESTKLYNKLSDMHGTVSNEDEAIILTFVLDIKEFEYYNFRKFFDEKDKFNKTKMENVDGK